MTSVDYKKCQKTIKKFYETAEKIENTREATNILHPFPEDLRADLNQFAEQYSLEFDEDNIVENGKDFDGQLKRFEQYGELYWCLSMIHGNKLTRNHNNGNVEEWQKESQVSTTLLSHSADIYSTLAEKTGSIEKRDGVITDLEVLHHHIEYQRTQLEQKGLLVYSSDMEVEYGSPPTSPQRTGSDDRIMGVDDTPSPLSLVEAASILVDMKNPTISQQPDSIDQTYPL